MNFTEEKSSIVNARRIKGYIEKHLRKTVALMTEMEEPPSAPAQAPTPTPAPPPNLKPDMVYKKNSSFLIKG